MASEYSATSRWIKFFSKAGLPSNVAANYAIIFTDNRIQLDMLMDLSKEYLYDMGIRVMGDVIAILRHAKETHNQLTKEKLMADISDSESTPSTVKRNTTVKRMLDHYTRPAGNAQGSSPSSSVASPKKVKLPVSNKDESMVVCLKRGSPSDAAGSMKKSRTVLPSNKDETYSVKLPLGTTQRSRKLLQLQRQQQQQQGSKKSVFQRLGDSAVSSTTDVGGNKLSTLFGRLGVPSGSSEVSTSTPVEKKFEEVPLKYQGVLKGLSSKRTVLSKRPTTISTDVSRPFVPRSPSVMVRLGPKPTSVSTVSTTTTNVNRTVVNRLPVTMNRRQGNVLLKTASQGIFGNNRILQNSDVKSRLGFQKASIGIQRTNPNIIRLNAGANKSSVFRRLGH